MKCYELTYILEDEAYSRLSALAERYQKINGWNEKDMLQFAVSATSKEDIEAKLRFLENQIIQIENENQIKSEKRKYISNKERKKCRKVVNAYMKELDKTDIIVIDAGRYGFVKLQCYKPPYGFDDTTTFINSLLLFNDLWDEWLLTQILTLVKGTPMEEMDYEDIFKHLSEDKQKEFMTKREYFAQKTGIRAD